jgi:hypothetical protein
MTPFRRLGDPWKTLGSGLSGSLGSLSGGGGVPVAFLFRDDFITAEGAPLASPRTAEPGPGTFNITDTGNRYSIVAEKLVKAAVGVGANDPRCFVSAAPSRAIGRAIICRFNGLANNLGRFNVGWDTNPNSSPDRGSITVAAGGTIIVRDGDFAAITTVPIDENGNYDVAIPPRTTGQFHLIKGTGFSGWTLLWVGVAGTSAFAGFGSDGQYEIDHFRISDLPSPWDTDFGIATDRLAGIRALGDTYSHEADFVGEYVCTTVPAAGTMFWSFRRQDVNNYWEVIIEPNQDITLREVVATVPTARGTSAGVVNNGDRIVVVADGTTISVYRQNVLEITYALAANFQTETDGEVLGVGNGRMDDIVTWPRVISGIAKEALDRVANA